MNLAWPNFPNEEHCWAFTDGLQTTALDELQGSLKPEEKLALSHHLCGFLSLTSKRLYISFFSSLEQPEGRREWRQGEESGEDCPIKRLLIHGYFLLKRDSFVYSTNINQFTEKMISSFISSWIKGHLRGLSSHTTSSIFGFVCAVVAKGFGSGTKFVFLHVFVIYWTTITRISHISKNLLANK